MINPLEGLLIGRTLCDRYRIEEVIGRGGMSVVYRATDRRLGRPVAVKVVSLPTGHEDRDELRARLRREAGSAARIPAHPNVVHVYDYGTDPELDLDFIVMELLRGRDLKAAMAGGAIGRAGSLRILRESARGIAAGHRAGIVHRDVKPANIFLVGDDRVETVKILDFGIAKALAIEPEDDLTRTGTLPHSPAYASPEQMEGGTPLTAASDVYQLGLVAYELMAGARPFDDADRARMRAGGPAAVPSRGRWAELPDGLRAAIARALEPRPGDRFADAAELAEALSAIDTVDRADRPEGGADRSADGLDRSGAGAAAPLSEALPPPDTAGPGDAVGDGTIVMAPGAGAPAADGHADDGTELWTLPPEIGPPVPAEPAQRDHVRAATHPPAGPGQPTEASPPAGTGPPAGTPPPADGDSPAGTYPPSGIPPLPPATPDPSGRARPAAPGRLVQGAVAAVLLVLAIFAITQLGGDEAAPDASVQELDTGALDEEFRSLIEEAAERQWEEGAEDEPSAAAEVEAVIIDLNEAWVRGDLGRHVAHYASRVDFYNSYGAPRSYIESERGRALERFPDREVTIERTAVTFPQPDRARALVDKSWEFGGGDLEWTGSARQELMLELRNGVWRVTGERDVEVYASERRD